jgi:hypothetical protein
MKIAQLRSLLSIAVVIVFVLVSAIVALTPVVGGYPPEPYTDHLKTVGSLYSGIVGLIIGYFFGERGRRS